MNARTSWLAGWLTIACITGPTTVSAQTQGQQPASSRQQSKNRYPPVMEGARSECYKVVGDTQLKLYIFEPERHQPQDRCAAAVFFFGGGWKSGSPQQFEQHCRYLAARGMVAMTVDYRVASRHGVKAVDCVKDAKTAIRWVRQHAEKLGIDPERILAAGGSAGGHLAACTATIAKYDAPGESVTISSVPNACALFNPALVLAPVEDLNGTQGPSAEKLEELGRRMGVEPEELSPYHQVAARSGPLPPMIVFHGQADTTVEYWTAEAFARAMQARGARCELKGYAEEGHGFFNYRRGDGSNFVSTLQQLDTFLVSLGFIEAGPSEQASALLRDAKR